MLHKCFGPGVGPATEKALIEEIHVLEGRLNRLGPDGDCAYERAMSARYRTLVEDRKALLSELRTLRTA